MKLTKWLFGAMALVMASACSSDDPSHGGNTGPGFIGDSS